LFIGALGTPIFILALTSMDAWADLWVSHPNRLVTYQTEDTTKAYTPNSQNDATPLAYQLRTQEFCIENVGYGPLRIASQSPFQSLRLGFTPRTPSTLIPNKWEVGLTMTLANVWSYDEDKFVLDYEGLQTTVHAAYGLVENWLVEITYDERRLWGGILDGFISDFHETFNIDQDSRDEFPNGQVYINMRDANGETLAYRDESGIYSRGLSVTLQNNLTCGTEKLPACAYSVTARYEFETTDTVDRESPFDFGASLMLSHRLRSFYAYLTGCFFWFGGNSIQEIELQQTQISGLAALEWNYIKTQSLIIQYLVSEGQAKDLGPFSEPSHEVTLGWKWNLKTGLLFECGLIENFIIYDNSPDFGIHLGMTYRP
jgi:hypothetical protein